MTILRIISVQRSKEPGAPTRRKENQMYRTYHSIYRNPRNPLRHDSGNASWQLRIFLRSSGQIDLQAHRSHSNRPTNHMRSRCFAWMNGAASRLLSIAVLPGSILSASQTAIQTWPSRYRQPHTSSALECVCIFIFKNLPMNVTADNPLLQPLNRSGYSIPNYLNLQLMPANYLGSPPLPTVPFLICHGISHTPVSGNPASPPICKILFSFFFFLLFHFFSHLHIEESEPQSLAFNGYFTNAPCQPSCDQVFLPKQLTSSPPTPPLHLRPANTSSTAIISSQCSPSPCPTCSINKQLNNLQPITYHPQNISLSQSVVPYSDIQCVFLLVGWIP
ncbi:hypothetical protein VP01_120g2 [Puccinia sorghi]|uniref:Uncharacterized protein n=1 Tax=Puccinia sorghi TaxID=27349 RepID=A0A0L6VQC3_9BASI|nr:hypothetical protein VP01_120g2 [Puccinia sorghi]